MIQAADNLPLLIKMMADQKNADALYRPTQYWLGYQDDFVQELKRYGLHDFRRRDRLGFATSKMPAFGACDWLPSIAPRAELLGWRGAGIVDSILRMLSKYLVARIYGPSNHFHVPQRSNTAYFHSLVQEKFDKLGLRLNDCPTSLVGNPEDVFHSEDSPFSLMHLTYCSMIIDALRHISPGLDLATLTYCEIGPGMGRQAEVIAKLFPSATIVCFDIAPQLYVSHQYFESIFADRLVPYDEAIVMMPEQMPSGKIVLLPMWRLNEWASFKIDLFWNSASFQEMEPDNAANYISVVKKMRPKYAYINSLPGGNFSTNSWITTEKPVTEALYKSAFAPEYSLTHEYGTDYLMLDREEYRSYIFERLPDAAAQ
jgi:putative sugar O-methyltransferase